MIDDALRTRLLAVAGVAALVVTSGNQDPHKNRVYPVILPQGPVFPAITYQLVGERRLSSFTGPIGLPGSLYRVDCWGATYTEASALADQVRLALDGWQDLAGAKRVQASTLQSQESIWEEETRTHRIAHTYRIWWDETP